MGAPLTRCFLPLRTSMRYTALSAPAEPDASQLVDCEDVVRITVDAREELRRPTLRGNALDVRTRLHGIHAIAVQHRRAATVSFDAVQLAGRDRHVPAAIVFGFGVHHVFRGCPPEIEHVVAFTRFDVDALLVHQIDQRQHRLAIGEHGGRRDVRAVRRNLHHLVARVPREVGERHRSCQRRPGQHAQDQTDDATSCGFHGSPLFPAEC